MTDPERILQRSSGLAAELLRAGMNEAPPGAGVERTLAALGVSGALLTGASVASGSAVASGAAVGSGAATATAAGGVKVVKTVSSLLLAKWIGMGVVGGVGLAGAAAVVSNAVVPPASVSSPVTARPAPKQQPMPQAPAPVEIPAPPPVVVEPEVVTAPRTSPSSAQPTSPESDVGTPLAAEVAYIDRARSLLAAGQSEQGLTLLSGYEAAFPEARLLPEVLFLRLETCNRLGRTSEARAAARRLVDGFPKSPHAARARKLLEP